MMQHFSRKFHTCVWYMYFSQECAYPRNRCYDADVCILTLQTLCLTAVIEKFTENVRFCMICNYLSKIIPALQSRCTRFRFGPLDPKQMELRLEHVIKEEGWGPILMKLLYIQDSHYSLMVTAFPLSRVGSKYTEMEWRASSPCLKGIWGEHLTYYRSATPS